VGFFFKYLLVHNHAKVKERDVAHVLLVVCWCECHDLCVTLLRRCVLLLTGVCALASYWYLLVADDTIR